MANLHDPGEEYILKNDITAATIIWGLYNTSDGLADSDNLTAITTEPAGASYARQTQAVEAADSGGDWQFQNSATITFDTSDSSATVDGWFCLINFQSVDQGDGSPQDNLIATGTLSTTYNLDDGSTNITSVDINSGTAGVSLN